MNFQSKKTSQFAHHMANARCGMVLPILVTVICMTVLFYYAMDPGLQIKVLETALYHFPTEKLENNVTRENNKVPSNVSDTVLIDEVPNKQVEKHPIYFFGDSLYDTGMGFHIGFGPMADSYPYGKTYFKRPAGRFSDGLLIPDFIARFAELPLPEPYANPLLVEYTNAVNFAGTSGCVLVDSRNNSLNLKMQTDLFEEMVGRMEEEYGVEKTKKLVSKAVLVFNIGSNDYTDFWIFNEKPFNSSLVDSFTNKVLGNLTTSVTRMYKKGARKFAFQNYGPIGCIPLYLRPDGSCAEDLNELATQHNARFAILAMEWTRRLPGFKFIIYDFYTSLTARVRHGSKYGFKETQTACCGSGQFNSKFTCMERSNFTLCDDISSHLFFDPAHPTQHADMQFAQEFWSGTPDVVTPVNLKTLLLDEE